MNPIIKIDIDNLLKSSKPVIIELGAGTTKSAERISIDKLDMPNVDIVADLEKGFPFLPDNSVDIIYSKSFLEHIDNLEFLMKEIWRVLKPNGKNILFVPHFSNPYYYSDFTHKRFFGLYSFEYFSSETKKFKRKVPGFYNDCNFKTEKITLVFQSPFKCRNLMKKFFQVFFNLNTWLMEFYEENLCYLIPCYAVQATLCPEKD